MNRLLKHVKETAYNHDIYICLNCGMENHHLYNGCPVIKHLSESQKERIQLTYDVEGIPIYVIREYFLSYLLHNSVPVIFTSKLCEYYIDLLLMRDILKDQTSENQAAIKAEVKRIKKEYYGRVYDLYNIVKFANNLRHQITKPDKVIEEIIEIDDDRRRKMFYKHLIKNPDAKKFLKEEYGENIANHIIKILNFNKN